MMPSNQLMAQATGAGGNHLLNNPTLAMQANIIPPVSARASYDKENMRPMTAANSIPSNMLMPVINKPSSVASSSSIPAYQAGQQMSSDVVSSSTDLTNKMNQLLAAAGVAPSSRLSM
jgi:hypothetical protein